MNPIAVIAIGGNSLTLPGEKGTFEEQQRNAITTCEGIAGVIRAGYRVVLTHGNGPQVGQALLRSELAPETLPRLRLDECDAGTQGEIGYLLQQTLTNVLAAQGFEGNVVSFITQVVVDPDDPAFQYPTKPIGDFYSEEVAREKREKLGWTMVEDAGRGWRRVVPSPQPLEIVELKAIRACLEAGNVVIAAGGGGIPVIRRGRKYVGVEAVIDKDRVSALLAKHLRAELLLFSTGVDRVALHFGTPQQQFLSRLTWEDARRYFQRGEFPPGSMGPKIEAALGFLAYMRRRINRNTRCRAIITSPAYIEAAVRGEAGTEILPPVVRLVVADKLCVA
jgi:carbamate kinase